MHPLIPFVGHDPPANATSIQQCWRLFTIIVNRVPPSHVQNILHCDLKSPNILLTNPNAPGSVTYARKGCVTIDLGTAWHALRKSRALATLYFVRLFLFWFIIEFCCLFWFIRCFFC